MKAPRGGYITFIDTYQAGMFTVDLGAGRKKADDKIDYAAGVMFDRRTGDQVRAGEVIARMISDSAYPKFNLQYRGKEQRDTVFWAVMKRGDSVISVFHSTTRGTKDLITTTEVIKHGPGFFRGLALARWLWNDKDDMAWGTCDGGACCKSPGR